MGFPGDTVVKNRLANVGDTRDTGLHPWVRKKEGRKEIISFLEKEMATNSSILAWKIPWTEERGGLQSMRSQEVGHDSAHT